MNNIIQSQNKAIRKHMENGYKVNALAAWKKFGVSCLHSRISDLRNKEGISVSDKWIVVRTKYGKKRVKEYFITE